MTALICQVLGHDWWPSKSSEAKRVCRRCQATKAPDVIRRANK